MAAEAHNEPAPPREPDATHTPRRGPDATHAPQREPDATHAPHRFEEGDETPPHGVRAMALVRWAMLAVVAIAALGSVYAYAAPLLDDAAHEGHAKQRYRCPMHPQIVSDQPGECPICHMTLEPFTADEAASAPPPDASTPPGTTPLVLALDRVQAIGVRTALVQREHAAQTLRLSAIVEAPEGATAEVHARTAGFVESISVKETGAEVRAGQPLASIYSPEVLQAEQELLATRGWPEGGPGASMAEAATKRLELLGVGAGTIDAIVKSGKPLRAVPIASPLRGYVTRKSAVLGSYVTPEMALFTIADLRRVYVIAHAPPSELASVRVGDAATFTSPSLPGRSVETKIDLVYPGVEAETRTARLRLPVDNPDHALMPGQIGSIEIHRETAEVLTIPIDAVVDTGRSVHVFLVEEGGRYVPRKVELGEPVGDRVAVKSGLADGDRVVSGATFLIDAESRMRASLAEPEPPPAPSR